MAGSSLRRTDLPDRWQDSTASVEGAGEEATHALPLPNPNRSREVKLASKQAASKELATGGGEMAHTPHQLTGEVAIRSEWSARLPSAVGAR